MEKINYKLSKGKFVELEISKKKAEALRSINRDTESHERKFKRRTLRETSLNYLHDKYEWEPADESVDVQIAFEREETKVAVREAIMKLTEKQRYLVHMRFYEDKSFSEIAQIFGVSKSAITQQFQTISKKLKSYLKDFWE